MVWPSIWWGFFWCSHLVLGGAFDWKDAKTRLEERKSYLAAKAIADNWEYRPQDFFQGIQEESWQLLVPLLSDYKLAMIRPEEFELGKAACKQFAKHLPKLYKAGALPNAFREAVYELLRGKDYYDSTSKHKVSEFINYIPYSWMETHGELFMEALVQSNPPRLTQLNEDTLAVLLNNPNNACKLITFDIISSLTPENLNFLSSGCVKAIEGLATMDLSKVVGHLRKDAFAEYNGALSKETIQQLSSDQVGYYGLYLKDGSRCRLLELHHLSTAAAAGIDSKCLYDYLTSSQVKIGLGELWKSISTFRMERFTEDMISMSKIPLEDFNFMTPDVLKIILKDLKSCPTVDVSFWNKERMREISSKCLHRILTETKAPVKFGESWKQVSSSIFVNFTRKMMLSLLNVDREDFNFMTPYVLKQVSSDPRVCSALGMAFWTEKTIEGISSKCLYTILDGAKEPIKLGKLWEKVDQSVLDRSEEKERSSWGNIHYSDFYFMSSRAVRTLLSQPGVCPTTELTFWIKKRIKHISTKCLHKVLTEAVVPVKLDSLWNEISWLVISNFTDEMRSSWLNIDLSDFYSMDLSVLTTITSNPGVCSTLGVQFWNKENIKAISASCLHTILIKAKEPVKLGELWEKIDWTILGDFTLEMKSAWASISHDDFYVMPGELLGLITSVPKVCLGLGVAFWNQDRIKSISGECLYELLAAHEIVPVRLGSLWEHIGAQAIDGLAKKTEFPLTFIHPNDYAFSREATLRAIRDYPLICGTLNLSFWTRETADYISENCLCIVLSQKEKPVKLGELWKYIPGPVLKAFKGQKSGLLRNTAGELVLKTFEKLDLLGSVAGSDFQYMPLDLLNLIFSSKDPSKHLPHPATDVVLSPEASSVSISPQRFASVASSAPNVAGQLLWYSVKLPENVLAACSGEDIRSLTLAVPGGVELLDWKKLFSKLEENYSLAGRAGFFDRMIHLISEDSNDHFCSTLEDLDEYLSLTWLHRNASKRCRLHSFDPDRVVKLFSTPELASASPSWRRLLEMHSEEDWGWISQSKRMNALLGSDCEFWSVLDSDGDQSKVFRALDSLIFKSITSECVLRLSKTFSENEEWIILFAKDAFSKHVVGQLPCSLDILSPEQISHLSKKTFANVDEPTMEEASRHVLFGISLDEFEALNVEQFRSLYRSQWTFVPENVKSDILWLQARAIQPQISDYIKLIDSGDPETCDYLTSEGEPRWKVVNKFKDALHLLLQIYKDEKQKAPYSDLLEFIIAIKSHSMRDLITEVFEESPAQIGGLFVMARDASDFRAYNRLVFNEMGSRIRSLALAHNSQSGFDRAAVIKLLGESPEIFAHPRARINSLGIRDGGGAIRALTDQLLKDVERDLVVPFTRVRSPEWEYERKREATIDGNGKFTWGVGKEVGMIAGIVFGKALQLDIRLPFALDLEFYQLLIDTSDKAIEEYYRTVYSQEISRFEQGLVKLFNAGKPEQLLEVLTRPESLRFTQLSTKASAEEAKNDIMTRANLWACVDDTDCYESIKEVEGPLFPKSYLESVLKRALDEFKGFVRELVRGLGMALPPLTEFKDFPVAIMGPFAKFLPKLLNARPISTPELFSKISIEEGSAENPVSFEEKSFKPSEILFAFIRSLDERQKARLIGVWTGSSTLRSGNNKLKVVFYMPNEQVPSIRLELCKSPISLSNGGEQGKEEALALDKEYRMLFEKFVKDLLGKEESLEPECPDGGIDFALARVSTCAESLTIYLQSAQQMFSSLFDMISTPLAAIHDD